jgi:hypothetical protein
VAQAQPAGRQAPQPPPNPLQATYQGAPGWLNPSYAQGAQSGYDTNLPSWLSGPNGYLSPQSTIQQILTGFAPQSAQATNNLNNTMAASGIVGGPANVAQTELQGQLAASLAPTLANAIQTAQGNVLGAQEFQSGQGLQQALANASLGEQTSLANQAAGNQVGEFNIGNQIGANQFNASAANNMSSQLAQMLYGGWGQELGQFGNLNSQELQGLLGLEQTGLGNLGSIAYGAGQNFPVQQSGDWGGLGQGLGGLLSMFGMGGGGGGMPGGSGWSSGGWI